MEAIRTTKDEGRVPRERALVPLALVTSPFGPGGKLKLGEPDSPLAQAVQGGAQVGKTVAEPAPAKTDGKWTMTAEELEQSRIKLKEYVTAQFKENDVEKIIEAFGILVQIATPQEILDMLEDIKKRENPEFKFDKRKILTMEAIGLLRTKHGMSDEGIVDVFMKLGGSEYEAEAIKLVLEQTEPRAWVVGFLTRSVNSTIGGSVTAMREKLMQFAKQVLLGEHPPTS